MMPLMKRRKCGWADGCGGTLRVPSVPGLLLLIPVNRMPGFASALCKVVKPGKGMILGFQ